MKLNKSISLFSFWDKKCRFSNKVFLAPGVKLEQSEIGDYSRIRHFTMLKFVTIGKFSSIGKHCKIGVAAHPLNRISTNLIFYQKNKIRQDWIKPIDFNPYKKTIIGNDVWIGEECFIPGGITIGNGAVIAGRSVVTKDVPPYAVVAGVPAKVIKYRFNKEVIKVLEESEWWNFSEEKIEKVLDIFTISNPEKDTILKYFNDVR
ncbi:MAG: CatB-related O-acetyltransferase [Lutibacter sp.]|nr:CatB-related O-acetyltransferase [Lutibacter sp.]MBP9600736.1 CatB-related O-acetyltransferase [Lutibacter sp.]